MAPSVKEVWYIHYWVSEEVRSLNEENIEISIKQKFKILIQWKYRNTISKM